MENTNSQILAEAVAIHYTFKMVGVDLSKQELCVVHALCSKAVDELREEGVNAEMGDAVASCTVKYLTDGAFRMVIAAKAKQLVFAKMAKRCGKAE